MASSSTEQDGLQRRRAALFAIYLRCEERAHRPDRSDGCTDDDCDACRCRGRGAPGSCRDSLLTRLPPELTPAPLEEAIATLAGDRAAGSAHAIRLALAVVCRGADVLAPSELESALRSLDQRLDGGRYQHLRRICADVRDRKQRFLAALNMLLGCQLRNFDVLWERFSNLVTEIEVSVETSRPIADFKGGLMDPRRWSENIPLVWPKAYLIQPPLPVDRAVDPLPDNTPTVDFSGLFYEEAAWPASIAALGLWRNVLEMTYSETADRVHFDFSESECLTSRYMGINSEGGIDCDEGFGDARALPDGWTRLAAKKAFRFTKPDLLVVPLNAISSIWLLFLLEAFVLFGACPII